MSDKLTAIKIKYPNGTYSDPIEISAAAANVRYNDVSSVADVLDSLDNRINQITAVGSYGELTALRVGADGVSYPTAREAVIANDNRLHEIILVKGNQPTEAWNKLWVNNDDIEEIEILTTDELEMIAPMYDADSTYAIGDYVVYNGELYRCNTTIGTTESWTSLHWNKTNVVDNLLQADTTLTISGMAADAKATGDEIADLTSAIDNIIGNQTGHNIIIGKEAGSVLNEGENNIIIAYDGNPSTDSSNNLIIGDGTHTSVIIAGKTLVFNQDGSVTWS